MTKKNLFKKLTALAVTGAMCFASMTTAFAQTTQGTIDESMPCSLTMYKYDLTEAIENGAWSTEDSYVASGYEDDSLEAIKDYAIEGVEFTAIEVADILQFTKDNTIKLLYGFNKDDDILKAIGLEDGAKRYADADNTDVSKWYFDSDTLNKALFESISNNEINTKNALEEIVLSRNDKTTMPLTDVNGKTEATGLDVGLYMIIETKVPEDVVDSTNPFFLSLPMTDPQGDNWNYDVVAYPKNETGDPTLEKNVRESLSSTGKIEDFKDSATGSAGDLMEYNIVSTLPTITSKAVYLTKYDFVDTISGLAYKQDYPISIDIFTDAALADKVDTWDLASGNFNVSYEENKMTISMTELGLNEINGKYSEHTIVITYGASITDEAVLGEAGNPNEVTLTWERTSEGHFDTLTDDAVVNTFGIDTTKLFSDMDSETATKENLFKDVEFVIYNETDKVYLKAELLNGVYNVIGFADEKADATVFVPQTVDNEYGKILIKGVENDVYKLTEISTADGYTLLKEEITVEITFAKETGAGASVNGNACTMYNDGESLNAVVTLSVINNKGFELPPTGDSSLWIVSLVAAMLATGAIIILSIAKKKIIKE